MLLSGKVSDDFKFIGIIPCKIVKQFGDFFFFFSLDPFSEIRTYLNSIGKIL